MKTLVRETDIGSAVEKYLTAQGLVVRREVPVTLPEHGQVFADLVGCKTDETGEYFTVSVGGGLSVLQINRAAWLHLGSRAARMS